MTFFYCTSKINNYYKVGIAESLSRIKKRLTTYRSANPKTTIKLFSELGNPDIEYSFKNKFHRFRVGKSECYNLRFDFIYKHFLKYQHKYNHLHQFWNLSTLFLSEYYFDRQVPEDKYHLTERQQREGIFDGFIPIVFLEYVSEKQDKKGRLKIEARYLDINKVDLKEYRSKFKKHLKEKWYGQKAGYADGELEKFYRENFKLKKIFKNTDKLYVQWPINEIIFKNFEKKYKSLIKKYPPDKDGTLPYYKRSDQKSITDIKTIYFRRKIESNFEELYDSDQIFEGLGGLKRKNRSHPLNYLTFLRMALIRLDPRGAVSKEFEKTFDRFSSEVDDLYNKKYNELNQRKGKIGPEENYGKNVINFLKNVSKYKKNK
jgi:hypothetical protein